MCLICSLKESEKQSYEKRIRELEIENARLKGENEVLRSLQHIPQRDYPTRPSPISNVRPFDIGPLPKRKPDIFSFGDKIQYQKFKSELPMLKQ